MYEKLSLAVDIIVCKIINGKICVLMVERNREPFIGHYGLIGGFVSIAPRDSDGNYTGTQKDESVEDACSRVVFRDIGINLDIKQFKVYSDPLRDKRQRIVSVCNYAIIPSDVEPNISLGNTVKSVKWMPISEITSRPKKGFAFDHLKMVKDFRKFLESTAKTSKIAFLFIPEKFAIRELKIVFDDLIGHMDNFSRFVKNRFDVVDTGESRSSGGRPASIYKLLT